MSYQYGQAVRLTDIERVPRVEPARELDVVEGGGIDARVRKGVSHDFLGKVALMASMVMLLVALGVCRVTITTYTVQRLSDNIALRSSIERAKDINAQLRIERSVLSSSSRICRIATQSYGMVQAPMHDAIALYSAEEVATIQTAQIRRTDEWSPAIDTALLTTQAEEPQEYIPDAGPRGAWQGPTMESSVTDATVES